MVLAMEAFFAEVLNIDVVGKALYDAVGEASVAEIGEAGKEGYRLQDFLCFGAGVIGAH